MTTSPLHAAAPVSRGRVLLLEDDESLAGLLARALRADGYQVDVLDAAESLPPSPRLTQYDVVLTDVHLAGQGTGHDVLARVRAALPSMPVILMTAYADVEGAMGAIGHGAYDYLPKPIEPMLLRRMLGEAIARRRLASSARPDQAVPAAPTHIVGSAPAMIDL